MNDIDSYTYKKYLNYLLRHSYTCLNNILCTYHWPLFILNEAKF